MEAVVRVMCEFRHDDSGEEVPEVCKKNSCKTCWERAVNVLAVWHKATMTP